MKLSKMAEEKNTKPAEEQDFTAHIKRQSWRYLKKAYKKGVTKEEIVNMIEQIIEGVDIE